MMRNPCSLRIISLGSIAVFYATRSVNGVRTSIKQDIAKEAETTLSGPNYCDAQIVKETCDKLTEEDGLIRSDTIKRVFAETEALDKAASQTLDNMWKTVVEPKLKGVSCMKLCNKTVSFLKKVFPMPPASDIGCYTVGGNLRCDVDLSPNAIKNFVDASADIPHSDHHHEEVAEADFSSSKHSQSEIDAWRKSVGTAVDDIKDPAVRIANLFRIYPDGGRGSFASIQGGSSLVEDEVQDWEAKVAAVNVKAKAYLNAAIMKFDNHETKAEFDFWFGDGTSNQQDFRERVQTIMQSVKKLLDNVAFAYDNTCESNVYAYVYPRPSDAVNAKCSGEQPTADEDGKPEKCVKNNKGQFVFYLCDLYMSTTNVGTQIETLLHEGSHHYSAYTTDVCMNEFYYGKPRQEYVTVPLSKVGDTPLGTTSSDWIAGRQLGSIWRKTKDTATIKMWLHEDDTCAADNNQQGYEQVPCSTLARLDPQKAVRNADNFCYYIAHAVSGASNAGDCATSGKFCVGDRVKTDVQAGGTVLFPYFEVGAAVDARDKDTEEWQTCLVTENGLQLSQLKIKCPIYESSFFFNQVKASAGTEPKIAVRWPDATESELISESALSADENGVAGIRPAYNPSHLKASTPAPDACQKVGNCCQVRLESDPGWITGKVTDVTNPINPEVKPTGWDTAYDVWVAYQACDGDDSGGATIHSSPTSLSPSGPSGADACQTVGACCQVRDLMEEDWHTGKVTEVTDPMNPTVKPDGEAWEPYTWLMYQACDGDHIDTVVPTKSKNDEDEEVKTADSQEKDEGKSEAWLTTPGGILAIVLPVCAIPYA